MRYLLTILIILISFSCNDNKPKYKGSWTVISASESNITGLRFYGPNHLFLSTKKGEMMWNYGLDYTGNNIIMKRSDFMIKSSIDLKGDTLFFNGKIYEVEKIIDEENDVFDLKLVNKDN